MRSLSTGFWVFDTDDYSLEFYENPFNYYHRIVWDDGSDYDLTKVRRLHMLRVVVRKKTDFDAFEYFLNKINFNNPHELKVIESFEEFSSDNVEAMIDLSSTEDLINEYIEDVATHTDKDKVKEMMLSIYKEATEETYDNI